MRKAKLISTRFAQPPRVGVRENGPLFRRELQCLGFTFFKFWRLSRRELLHCRVAPFNEVLSPGVYSDTARFPFQDADQPGLTLSGNHRGNNRNGGFFEVFEAERHGLEARITLGGAG